MNILWISDSPNQATGYGTVTKHIVSRLAEKGFSISVLGLQSFGQPLDFGNYKVFPRGREAYGADMIQSYIKELDIDAVITLGDLKDFMYFNRFPFGKVKWIPYYPMDGVGMPLPYTQLLRKAHIRIAMSHHTKRETEQAGLECELIYHGVDTSIFKPLNKKEIRTANSMDDSFVIGCVARNQLRKMIPRLLEAYSIFSKDKDDIKLLLHTTPIEETGNNLFELLDRFNLANKAFISEKTSLAYGVSDSILSNIYNLFDVHALATSGEGYGLPIIESMACGVPNVLTDITTSRELIEGRGELARVQAMIMGPDNIERGLVDVKDFADKLQILYDDRKKLENYSKKCVDFAKQYEWSLVVKDWVNLLESV